MCTFYYVLQNLRKSNCWRRRYLHYSPSLWITLTWTLTCVFALAAHSELAWLTANDLYWRIHIMVIIIIMWIQCCVFYAWPDLPCWPFAYLWSISYSYCGLIYINRRPNLNVTVCIYGGPSMGKTLSMIYTKTQYEYRCAITRLA